jgi:hypothetical protein
MLNPNSRMLYTGALTPPHGFVFDQAVATSYSLDLTTLLTIPVHLALSTRVRSDQGQDLVAMLDALRRVSGRITAYVQQGLIQGPSSDGPLLSLLESMVAEVSPPPEGVFHPKLWVLRFRQADGDEDADPFLRLLVLSRNLTQDRSWDLLLQLDGRPSGRYVATNRPLGELIGDLPSMASRPEMVTDEQRRRTALLADEVRRTKWEPPGNWESVAFQVLGRGQRQLSLPRSKRMAVISPFLRERAVRLLQSTTDHFEVLISRPEELDGLSGVRNDLPQKLFVLNEACEADDGESVAEYDTIGLHAKVYVLEKGWYTHLFLGSANATDNAVVEGRNIEIVAELVGKRSKVTGIDDLLGQDSMGKYLTPYEPEPPTDTDEEEEAAQEVLERARSALAAANMVVHGESEGGEWRLFLQAEAPVELPQLDSLRAWPVTVLENRGRDATNLVEGESVDLGYFTTAELTGLVAFEVADEIKGKRLRFTLNLPHEGFPEDRDAAVFAALLRNRRAFLRYLLALLSRMEDFGGVPEPLADAAGTGGTWKSSAIEVLPLLEELTRTLGREPDRLREIEDLVKRLQAAKGEDGEDIVPPQFLELWEVFRQAMEARRKQ